MVLYPINEAENPGKSADCVISLLHHYLGQHSHGKKCVYLHTDNCVRQNKNNASIQYLLWRVLNGFEESIELSFMLVGHTKFAPDRYLGLFKKAFRRSSVSTLTEVSAIAERATNSWQIAPQLIHDVTGKKLATFYQWSAYLSFSVPSPTSIPTTILRCVLMVLSLSGSTQILARKLSRFWSRTYWSSSLKASPKKQTFLV